MDLRFLCVCMIGLIWSCSSADEDVGALVDYCQNKTGDGYSEQGSEQLLFECLTDEINSYPRNERQDLFRKLHHDAGFQDAVEKCMDSHRPIPICDPESKYRTLDGSCNNLLHPTWGRTGDCMQRLLPVYYKGTHNMRESVKGGPLPLARDVSAKLCSGRPQPSPVASFLLPVFGQFVGHEMSFTTPTDGPSCCPASEKKDPRCSPIIVEPDDPFYGKYNVTCISQSRTDPCSKCTLGKRVQTNPVTASIDASNVYGTSAEESEKLRMWDGTGRLITENDLLPSNHDPKQLACPKDQIDKCFTAGDSRVNQHSGLMSTHTVFLREHNRIVTQLKILNPRWTEEQLFQEGRKIVGALEQVIVYKEMLPPLLGPDAMKLYNLSIRVDGLGTTYSPNVRLGVFSEHSTAAFRLHSLVAHWTGYQGADIFRDLYSNWKILRDGNVTAYLSSMRTTAASKFGKNLPSDMNKYFRAKPGGDYGQDLAAIDVFRGRDHGLPPYAKMVEYCSNGELKINSFDDLTPVMSPRNIRLLKESYEDVQDVDLWIGMILEFIQFGSLIGSTNSCVIGKQFHRAKFGDRFFFEHTGEVPSFTQGQRLTLTNCSWARLLCDNTDTTEVQRNAFLLPGQNNPITPCSSIPVLDLTLWKE